MTTNYREWRKQRENTLTLPSGLTVQVKKIDIANVIRHGSLPTPVADALNDIINKRESTETATINLHTFGSYGEVIEIVVKAAVVAPILVDTAADADDEHMDIHDLPLADQITIFNWAQQEAAPLASFPA